MPCFQPCQTLTGWISILSKTHRHILMQHLGRLGLHPGQEFVLAELSQCDGLTQADLARKLNVTPPTVNKVVTRMEESGIVERRSCPSHNRYSRVHLTEKGRALMEDLKTHWDDLEKRTRLLLTEQEAVDLEALLRKVVHGLGTEPLDFEKECPGAGLDEAN